MPNIDPSILVVALAFLALIIAVGVLLLHLKHAKSASVPTAQPIQTADHVAMIAKAAQEVSAAKDTIAKSHEELNVKLGTVHRMLNSLHDKVDNLLSHDKPSEVHLHLAGATPVMRTPPSAPQKAPIELSAMASGSTAPST